METLAKASNPTRAEWNECMVKVQQGDKAAFAKVFKHFSPRLKQFAYKHVGNEQVAMELVQDALAAVWQKSHLFDGSKSALSTWIYTIARNLCFDLLRKQKGRELHVHSEDIWPDDYCPPDLVDRYSPERNMLREQIVRYLDTLPVKQKDVVKAIYLDELPHQEVADKFDIPLGTVKSRLRLAVEKLKDTIRADQV
ncbi:sigma-70 family RNA polymerase sigma factor [Vibrio breoganii]|uniref:RNA polymerase subunit sigma n=1 Tax=Vibrio breoganii TaxID=553239 RepID=A0AAP8MVM2_9VIBR|nr:sigma-70 family RNA polymerase sigma factor [Vibrio breoganii]PMI21295.1 RNA polymerase subunit sigma [Vibrio breoganii]PMP06277.1 RNA polymerase subunit sigma [Vibrio breoganii]PMP10274.1 RNA polymerase subunit sigma [Vibrio breoganii]